ncbi:MAG: hypothetical protein K9G46_02760 [Flavobacteriales bacterium]|nr:hypothetical protein [Flavobacteriales bacterium]
MRPLVIIPVIILVGVILTTWIAQGQTYAKEIVLLTDVTETDGLQPEMDVIKEHFQFKNDSWAGIRFTTLPISNLSLNRVWKISIPQRSRWFSNQLERDKEVKGFLSEFDRISAEQRNEKKGREHSSVYLPLAKQLNALAQSKADERTLIVYSDLMEHGDISFYDAKTFTVLKDTPARIISMFQQQLPLSNLQGITVHLVYRPLERNEDSQFAIASKLYRQMLEGRGAKVFIQAGLDLTQ